MKKEENKEKNNNEILIKKIEELEKKVTDIDNSWKRSLADYKNLEKRTTDEKIQFAFYIKKQVIESILPFLDNLERLDKHLEDEGLKLILKDLKQTFKDMGIEEIQSEGKAFDSNIMDAVEVRKGDKNIVLETLVKGYLLNGNLLRPAKVVVGQN